MRNNDKPLPMPPRDDRPGDDWICGWSDAGTPCQHGPSGKGDCPALSACRPIQDAENDDAWSCNRPACLGGSCESGPSEDGVCGLKPTPCTPKRSWNNRRRIATSLCFLSSIGFILIALGGAWRTEIFAPGDLVQPHAQILGGDLKSERCASCHPAARGSLSNWFFAGSDGHQGITQTQLCMDCHHNTIDRDLARNAHSLSVSQLELVSASIVEKNSSWHHLLPAAAVNSNDVACATCHREHHGSDADLAALTSQQCQSCHKSRFASFADGHPQWTDWPYGRGGKIAFDHASHAGKHFVQENAKFDCKRCHAQTADQEMVRTASFEIACASCHAKSLKVGIDEGFAIIDFPMLDTKVMSHGGHAVDAWPDEARGMFGGKLSPVVRLLLRADPKVADALDRLPCDGDFSRLNPNSADDLAAAKHIADAIDRLMCDLADNGCEAIANRLSIATGIDADLAGQLAGKLSPQLIQAARKDWLPPRVDAMDTFTSTDAKPDLSGGAMLADEVAYVVIPRNLRALQIRSVANWEALPQNPLRVRLSSAAPPSPEIRIAQVPVTAGDDEELDPLLQPISPKALPLSAAEQIDPLSETLAAPVPLIKNQKLRNEQVRPKRFDARKQLPAGGWYNDPIRLAVRYQPRGHADEVLVALVGLANSSTRMHPTDHEAIMKMPAVTACVKCHRTSEIGSLASWRAENQQAKSKTFTRFSHRPHMNLPMLSDCSHCHQVAASSMNPAIQKVTTSSHITGDFDRLSLDACVKCHTPQAAGDQCTKCHRYHIDMPHRIAD